MEKVTVTITDAQLGKHKKVVTAESREALEERVEEIARVCLSSGFFDDDDEAKWVLIPSSAILRVVFEFGEAPF